MNKKSKPINRPNLPAYVRQYESDAELAQVSVRIPLSEKKRFDDAQARLRETGMDMPLTDVIRDALRGAANFVSTKCEQPKRRATEILALFEDAKPAPRDVEHSSSDDVEEWGASGQRDTLSTPPEDQPLQGSTTTELSAAGVVLCSDGDENGQG